MIELDPFITIDRACRRTDVRSPWSAGGKSRPEIKIGICGEHGGDPSSIDFCERVGLDYVSCSPYRVPVARLAAAQARFGAESKGPLAMFRKVG